jgi:hypothetical protein
MIWGLDDADDVNMKVDFCEHAYCPQIMLFMYSIALMSLSYMCLFTIDGGGKMRPWFVVAVNNSHPG